MEFNIFSIFGLFGGLAFFLYGMRVMSDGLEKASGGALNRSLQKVTGNKFLAMVFGAGMTIAVQSSSAVTVMLVGLVNSGILEFGQTIGVLMGSNIGTTLTAWITSLASIGGEGGGVSPMDFLKPENFSPIFALVGILLIMMSKKERKQNVGYVLVGFAVLMFGMELMSDSMKPLAEVPEFKSFLTAFKNPLVAVLVGAVFTGIIQSSAATIGILQSLAATGMITYGAAIPLIMGLNIGTCVTAVISSIGVNRNARKVSVVHLAFNIIGTLIFLIPFCILEWVFKWEFLDASINAVTIAVVHTIFNIATTIILIPFTKQLEGLANRVIPEKDKAEDDLVKLDDRLLMVPTMAVKRCFEAVADMCSLATAAFGKSIDMLERYDERTASDIEEMEGKLDRYEDVLGTYMMKLSKIGVSEEDSKSVSMALHTIDDFERIGDHALDMVFVTKELLEKKQSFSAEAKSELAKLNEAMMEILKLSAGAFEHLDLTPAAAVEPLEEVINNMIFEIRRNHIARLQTGECSIDVGFTLNDILNHYARVAAHCSNVGVAVIEAGHGTFDTHRYLDAVKHHDNMEFDRLFKEYAERFSLN